METTELEKKSSVQINRNSENLVLILPGAGANVSGEHEDDDRYDQVAQRLLVIGSSVVQISNIFDESLWPPEAEEKNARDALEYASEVADGKRVIGLGFSAGARMLAQYAHEYDAVEHLALINPHPGFEPEAVLGGAKKFKGTMNIAVGLKDEQEVIQLANSLCHSGSNDCVQYVNGANHLFEGLEDKFIDLATSLVVKPKELS